VQGRDGGWMDVTPVAGSLVVNIGDIMAQWTNDVWVSSMHRVIPPPPALAASSRRQSMTYFFHPNYDAVIECMPSCAGPTRSPKYPPTVAHEFAFGKTIKSFDMAVTG
jgi:isopenicillin N synthase-like dioxygenase